MPLTKPTIGITMGDAAGIGPEIIVKAFANAAIFSWCDPLVIGDSGRLRQAAEIVGANIQITEIESPRSGMFKTGNLDCVDLSLIPAELPFGRISATCGDAAYQFLERAVALALRKEIHAIVTAPLNKEALRMGGHEFPGHTEILAELTQTPEVSLMLVGPRLKVIHVTAHIGLIDAIERITPELVERTIERGRNMLGGEDEPRIGVCGINPHAGENGLFGRGEEEQKIMPAVRRCRERGWQVEGPMPADTLFYRAGRGDFDLVVAMYHDQGHGPFKVLGIEHGVNVTAGLPIIRTSVDHGTAFDLAGRGLADEQSLLAALKYAVELVMAGDPSLAIKRRRSGTVSSVA
jgi:4-phospho-D-threonate 3-dehydrogenase / 4-phospho-D-erythronate 3-dehydrogenase